MIPKIQPIKPIEYNLKQSKYPMVPRLPCRSILVGPSGSGKSVLLTNLIMDVYRGCFSRIYIFSPSIDVDSTWLPVKKYIEEEMKIKNTKEEPIYFDHYTHTDLEKIIDTQHKVIDYMKKHKEKKLYSILIVLDDVADSPEITRHSKLLHGLYTRGRHNCISTITAVQKFNTLHPLISVNATELYIYRLRNYKDLESLLEELGAVANRKTILNIYNMATEEPYSFLYVNLESQENR
jgi:hypothetical protein